MGAEKKDLGHNDASVTSHISNIAGNIASSVLHKPHLMIEQYAQLFAYGVRTPVLRGPDDYGRDYEGVTFPSIDGVPLEGWCMPAKGSDRLLRQGTVFFDLIYDDYTAVGIYPHWGLQRHLGSNFVMDFNLGINATQLFGNGRESEFIAYPTIKIFFGYSVYNKKRQPYLSQRRGR